MVQQHGLKLRWVHFPLHPETPPEGKTLEALFAGRDFDLAAAKARMRQLMAAESLPYGERTHTYNSRLAQELAFWADEQEGGAAVHDALFKRYFVDGANLAEPNVLLDLVDRLGLPRAEAQEVLDQRSYAAKVDQDWALSRQLGITGVPTFVFQQRAAVGAQPYEVLEQLVTSDGHT